MTKTQRAAMQQALEALESMSACYVGDDDDAGECASCHEPTYKPHAADCKKANAIEALRSALAEPEPPIWQTLAEIGASAPAGTWDAPVGPPASPSLTPAQGEITDIHSCSYYCNRPECVLAQRNELRDKLAQQSKPQPILVGWLVSPHGEWKPNHELIKVSFPAGSLDWKIPVYVLGGNK